MTRPSDQRPFCGALRILLLASCTVAVALLAACSKGSDGSVAPDGGIAGAWVTQGAAAQTKMSVQLALTGSSLSGTGTLSTPPLAPISGPAMPTYTGDNFTITTGSFSSPTVSFTATLGANPDGAGGFFRGTLLFSGTLNGGTMSGTLTFTPPRSVTQIVAGQTVSGMTLVKP